MLSQYPHMRENVKLTLYEQDNNLLYLYFISNIVFVPRKEELRTDKWIFFRITGLVIRFMHAWMVILESMMTFLAWFSFDIPSS